MYRSICQSMLILLLLPLTCLSANESKSFSRTPLLSNDKVNVWQTIIYPNKESGLPMHRHETNRVIIALSDATLKITNNKNEVEYFELEKDHVYYLTKNPPGELHKEENVTDQPAKIMVVELKD